MGNHRVRRPTIAPRPGIKVTRRSPRSLAPPQHTVASHCLMPRWLFRLTNPLADVIAHRVGDGSVHSEFEVWSVPTAAVSNLLAVASPVQTSTWSRPDSRRLVPRRHLQLATFNSSNQQRANLRHPCSILKRTDCRSRGQSLVYCMRLMPVFTAIFAHAPYARPGRHAVCTPRDKCASRVPAELNSVLDRERQSRKLESPGYTAG